jgi:hypothetical protein
MPCYFDGFAEETTSDPSEFNIYNIYQQFFQTFKGTDLRGTVSGYIPFVLVKKLNKHKRRRYIVVLNLVEQSNSKVSFLL